MGEVAVVSAGRLTDVLCRCLRLKYEHIESTIATITTSPSLTAAIDRYTLTGGEMAKRIFEVLDTHGTGLLSFAALGELSYRTDGVAMEYKDYLQIAETVGFSPDLGIDLRGLCRVYLELKMGDVCRDYDVITAASTSGTPPPPTPPMANGAYAPVATDMGFRSSSPVKEYLTRVKSPTRASVPGRATMYAANGESAVTLYLRTSSSPRSSAHGASPPCSPRPPGSPSAVSQYMRSQSPHARGSLAASTSRSQIMNGGTDGVNVHLNGHGQGDARQLPKPTWALETAAGGGQDHAGVAKLKVQLADAQAALAAQAATARARDGQVAEQAATMRADLAKARNELTVKCAEVGQLRAQLSAKVAMPEPTDAYSEARAELAGKFTQLQALRAELESANEGTRTAKAQATAEVAEAKAAHTGLAQKLSELQRLQSELEAAKEKATAEAADAKASAEILKSEIKAAKAETKRAQAKCTELSDELRKVRSVQTQV